MAQGQPQNFITRSGDRLMEGQREFRFVSVNIPNLHYIEDNLPFQESGPWRLPDEFEIRDALLSVEQMGGRVVRTYTLSVRKSNDDPSIPRHVLRPGEFNEAAFLVFDKILQVANERGIKVIIPFVDQWPWFGGIAEYAAFRGKKAEEFWTDPQIIEDFKQTVRYLVNRKNTYTGVPYRDDKAILAWETGNELSNPPSWSREIAAFVKSLDQNHLVLDGYNAGSRGLQNDVLSDPNIDIVTTHHYPDSRGGVDKILRRIQESRQRTKGNKAYFLGEFGFIPLDQVKAILDLVASEEISGALIWSLRFHNRDGGFYWHSEPLGGGLYKAYHWPGFQTGDAYEEAAVLALLRERTFQLQGMPVPPLTAPSAPTLLPISSAQAISWQGSAGASGYDVQRATSTRGPWSVVGSNIDDTMVQYRPLFSDEFAELGKTYYYRVVARNRAGQSSPSNVVGPVRVSTLALIDEMRDYGKTFSHEGPLVLVSNDTRKSKEDSHRLKGKDGASIMYRTLEPIRSARLSVFFEGEVLDFEILGSGDGIGFTPLEAKRRDFFGGKGDYDYWKPVEYQVQAPGGTYFLKLVYKADAQLARVEIDRAR